MPAVIMPHRLALLLSFLGPLLAAGAETAPGKPRSGLVTAAMRDHAIRNVQRYDWARLEKETILHRVEPFLALADEELWALLPSQEMGREHHGYVHGRGCPNCLRIHGGREIGRGEWVTDLLGRPWQVQCTRCGEWFPKNDFASYYQSSLDDQHKFRIGTGDPRFLEAMPDVAGEARQWVEDGTGLQIGEYQWFFAAHYGYRMWRTMAQIAEDFATLYTFTGDPLYAYKAGIILDRMADLYPEMDETPHRLRGMTTAYGPGRIMGDGWEYGAIRNRVSRTYDLVFDALIHDARLAAFSSRMAARHRTGDKSTPEALEAHIRENLLMEFVRNTMTREVINLRGWAQRSVAQTAVALDRPEVTDELLAWLFRSDGGKLPILLHDFICRDGFGPEVGQVYASIPGTSMVAIADLLPKYERYRGHDIYRDYPKFANVFTMMNRTRLLDKTQLALGDAARQTPTMGIGQRLIPMSALLSGYRVFGGTEIAREIWFAAERDWDRVPLNIYDEEPLELRDRLRKDLSEEPENFESFNSGGYGLAVMQAPFREHPRAAAVYYGRAMVNSHSHADRLSLHLVSHDSVMLADLGYPLYTGAFPERHGFTRHVISHNTVMINDTTMKASHSGKSRLFAEAGPFRVTDVDGLGPDLYDGVTTYRRFVAMIDVDEQDSYLLDLFWVRGGRNHRLIQNGGGPEVTHAGLTLTAQESGTFAGEDVPWGEPYDADEVGWNYAGTGFQYLDRVERGGPVENFWVDWRIVEPRRSMPPDWRAHVRVHNLTSLDEVALADGKPPRMRENPDRLRYLLRTRLGEGLHTQFISVIEPHAGEPFIESARVVERIEDERDFGVVVQVKFKGGRSDLLLVRENEGDISHGDVQLKGRAGLVRMDKGHPVEMALVAGERLRAGSRTISLERGWIQGQLDRSDESDINNTILHLDTPVPLSGMEGRYIFFDNAERSDASYRIASVDGPTRINIGRKALIERLVDKEDFSKGLHYTIDPGNTFRIPLTTYWKSEDAGTRTAPDRSRPSE